MEIQLINCYKIYREKRSSVETVALKGIDISFFKGEFASIVGPSGSGKSTLLNLIGGLDLPNAGSILHKDGNYNISTMKHDERDTYRIQNVGYLQQKPILMGQYTAIENVELPLVARGILNAREMAEYWLNRLQVREDVWHSIPQQLSGGERQRVSLASALVFNPSILLADEPTAEVDYQTAQEILKIFKELKEKGMTIIVVTHDNDLANVTDRSFVLEDGMITERHIQKEEMSFGLELDEFERCQIPAGVLEILSNPTMIALDPIKDGYIMQNAELYDAFTLKNNILLMVDRDERVKLENIGKKQWKIDIVGKAVYLREVEV